MLLVLCTGAVVLPSATVTSETPHLDNLSSGSHGPCSSLSPPWALGPFCRERCNRQWPRLVGWLVHSGPVERHESAGVRVRNGKHMKSGFLRVGRRQERAWLAWRLDVPTLHLAIAEPQLPPALHLSLLSASPAHPSPRHPTSFLVIHHPIQPVNLAFSKM